MTLKLPGKKAALSYSEYIEGVEKGCTKTLKTIYELHYFRIEKFILNNSGNKEDAQDVFQDALMVILKQIKEKKHAIKFDFHAYIFTICQRCWYKKLRDSRLKYISEEVTEPGFTENMDELIDSFERERLFKEKLGELDEVSRKILLMYFNGASMREIALKMGFSSVGYTKKRKFIVQQRLIENIKKDPRFWQMVYLDAPLKVIKKG